MVDSKLSTDGIETFSEVQQGNSTGKFKSPIGKGQQLPSVVSQRQQDLLTTDEDKDIITKLFAFAHFCERIGHLKRARDTYNRILHLSSTLEYAREAKKGFTRICVILVKEKRDAESFDILYRLYKKEMIAYCFFQKMMVNEQDALDVIHDAFLKAWVRINQLNDDSKFKLWLRSIIDNLIRDSSRQCIRRSVASANYAESKKEDNKKLDKLRELKEIIEIIPDPLDRYILYEHYWRKRTYCEITADLSMGLSVDTIKKRSQRARRWIYERMKDQQ